MVRRMSCRRLVIALIIAGSAAPALALDLPARKPGLWELNMSFEGRNLPPQKTHQCIDAETDKMLSAVGGTMSKEACSKQDVQHMAGAIVVDSVCSFSGIKSTSHAVVSGDFNSAYTVKVDSKREGGPRIPGMPADGTSHMTIAAKWLGPCKAGQKPGDIIMSNGMTMNIRNMPAMPSAPRH